MPHPLHPCVPSTYSRSLTNSCFLQAHITCDLPHNKHLFSSLCKGPDVNFTINQLYPIKSHKLWALHSGAELSETVINAYLYLLTTDLQAEQFPSPHFKIFDTVIADRIHDSHLTPTFGPPGHPHGWWCKSFKPQSWVPDVTKSLLMLPVFHS